MKKLIWALLALVMVSVSFSSCDSGFDEDLYSSVEKQKKEKGDTTPSTPPTPPTPKDTTDTTGNHNPNTDDGVYTVVSKTFNVDQSSKLATSLINLQNNAGKTASRKLEYNFSWTFSVPSKLYITESATPTKGSTTKSGENNVTVTDTTWKVVRTFESRTNIPGYTGKIVSTRREGYTLLNGKKEPFKNGNETVEIVSVTPGTKTEKTVNDSIFYVTPCTMTIKISLGGKSWSESRPTELWRFIKMKSNDNTTPTTNNMPTPDVWADKVVNITSSMSPEFASLTGNDNIKQWHIATLVEGKDYVYIFVDGSYKGKEANPGEGKLNSAFYAEGSWHAAAVSKEGSDFVYVFRVNGQTKSKRVPENLALISGLQNFQSNGNAAQSWMLKTYKETKSYSDGTQYKVWVQKNNSSERVYTFTVGVRK